MQATHAGVLGVLAISLSLSTSLAVGHVATASEEPIPRVVGLLKHILENIETESKTEEDLYEKFICWGKKTISSKTASNSDAQIRIDSLKQYVADLDAGAIELTSERTDLNKDIQQTSEGLEMAKNKRDQENKDYEMAKDEMEKAIAALTEAIDVLEVATKDHKNGTLLEFKEHVNEGMYASFADRRAQGLRIDRAIEIADKYLHKGDALFFRRVLTGEVPDVDWKKLNRKATFKMSYKARSFSIQTILKKLLETFTTNLNDANTKEGKAVIDYNSLKGAMDGQLSASQEALTKLEKENGARGMSKADAESEIGSLSDQITNDVKFIGQTQASMKTKTEEWKQRSATRAEEIKAINEAIAILFNDDKRDLFKKSFKSQGYSFLQLKKSSSAVYVMSHALQTIAQAGRMVQDDGFISFVQNVTTKVVDSSPVNGTHFKVVIAAIDDMLAILKGQENEDLTKKEDCEKKRMQDARDAIKASRDMDELTDDITRLTGEIEELAQDIASLEAKMKKDKETIDEALKVRTEENTAWSAANKDDQEAAATVLEALKVLEKFYKKSSFLQKQAPAGQAPAAPPTTWVEPYTGQVEEGKGVISILELVHEDIQKDIKKTKDEEDASQGAYDAAKTAYDKQKLADDATKLALEGTKGDKEEARTTATSDRSTKFGELNGFYAKIDAGEKACNYFTINYPLRRSNRLIEIDGLTKAKAILQSGRFTAPADPTREIKPGDALLQRLRRH